MRRSEVDKQYIVTDVTELRQKMKGRQNITLYIPKHIKFFMDEEDLLEMHSRNIKLEKLE